MRKIILISAIIASTLSFSQSLETKIPAEVQAVISINGENLLDLMTVTDLDNNAIGKEIIKDVSRKNPDFNSLSDFGFDLESKAFYFYQPTDSISYHNFLIKLKNRKAFEQMLDSNTSVAVNRTGNVSSFLDRETTIMWNDNTLLFTVGEPSYSYFKDNEERFKKQAENEDEYYYQTKIRIASGWTSNYCKMIFNYNGASILLNKNYLEAKDNKAVASAWINNYIELMTSLTGRGLFNYSIGLNPNFNNLGFGSMNFNLYFEKDATRLTYTMNTDNKWKKSIKKMYKSKINRSFFKYFDINDVLGYTSIALNTEAVLEEYPNMMSDIYGGILPKFKEETAVSAELLSLILDEKAIGELITGNALLILNDLGEKEVTYTTYEYDDEYNETEVEKTKKEMSPDFTFMIGSENEEFLYKVIDLGVKHSAFEKNANYYKLNMPNDVPFDLYAIIKDEIVFITSSEKQLKNIVSSSPHSNVGTHKNRIRKNAAVMYLNIEKLLFKLPVDEFRADDKKMISFASKNLGNAYYTLGKVKGSKLVSEITVETASNRENSLRVLLDFIDFLAK